MVGKKINDRYFVTLLILCLPFSIEPPLFFFDIIALNIGLSSDDEINKSQKQFETPDSIIKIIIFYILFGNFLISMINASSHSVQTLVISLLNALCNKPSK